MFIFRIKGNFIFTTGVKIAVTELNNNARHNSGGAPSTYHNRFMELNIALLKNVDTDISLIKTIDGDDIFYTVRGAVDDIGGEFDVPLDYDFSKNCYIDLNKDDTISIGMLHKLRGRIRSHNNEIKGPHGGINECTFNIGSKTYAIIFRVDIKYEIDRNNYFSIIKVDQNIDLDIEIPINSMDYKIQKASNKNFTEIIVENTLTLKDDAIFKAKNIDFSGIPNSYDDVSFGYLYQDSGFIKIRNS